MATERDAADLIRIYEPYVLETAISFETVTPTLSDFKNRMIEILPRHPWLVCELQNKVVGYAYAGPFKSRCAYLWSAESTVYVDRDFHGRGIGKDLYKNLLGILRQQGIVNVIAGIALPNEASQGLHESLGFTKVAQFKEVGYKLEKWWDVGYWQLQLGRPDRPSALQLPMLDRFK
jgi:phosphinothricin acetyltransferase